MSWISAVKTYQILVPWVENLFGSSHNSRPSCSRLSGKRRRRLLLSHRASSTGCRRLLLSHRASSTGWRRLLTRRTRRARGWWRSTSLWATHLSLTPTIIHRAPQDLSKRGSQTAAASPIPSEAKLLGSLMDSLELGDGEAIFGEEVFQLSRQRDRDESRRGRRRRRRDEEP